MWAVVAAVCMLSAAVAVQVSHWTCQTMTWTATACSCLMATVVPIAMMPVPQLQSGAVSHWAVDAIYRHSIRLCPTAVSSSHNIINNNSSSSSSIRLSPVPRRPCRASSTHLHSLTAAVTTRWTSSSPPIPRQIAAAIRAIGQPVITRPCLQWRTEIL